MDAPADKSNWCAPRLADLRRQRSKPCWLYRHEYYLWIVKVDRETNHEDVPTTEIAENPESPGRGLNLDEMQDQLDGFGLSSGSYWQYLSEDAELDIDEEISGSDENSLYGSSSSDSNHEIVAKRSEPAPATSTQVTKIGSFQELIRRIRIPLPEQHYIEDHGWKPTSNPNILDNISRSLFAISFDSRVVPLEVKDDPCVAHHLGYSFDNDIITRNIDHLMMMSPSPLGYDRVRLEFADLMRVLLASQRLQPTIPRRGLTRNAWHSIVHLPLMQLLRIQYPEFSVEQVRYTEPEVLDTSMYTAATPRNEIADFELSWESDRRCLTDEEATRFDTSLISFWPPENPHDSIRIVVTETRRLCNSDWAVETQLALSAMSQIRQFHRRQNGDAYFSFAIPMLVAIRHEWFLYFALDGEKIEGVKYGTLGYTERLDTSLMLLGMVKAVVGFVDEEVLPGYRAEVLHEGKDGGKVGRISELGMTDSLS